MSKENRIGISQEKTTELGWLDLVRQHVESIRFGVVQVVVHDAHVTQIEKTERVRLDRSRSDSH